MSPGRDDKPWLANKAWAGRNLHSGRLIGWPVLLLAYVFFGGIAAGMLAFALQADDQPQERLGPFAIGATFLGLVGVLTYWWLRHRRYGDSTCTLITLPGVIGGWLKAGVECKLPLDTTEPVVIRLKNSAHEGRSTQVLWQKEYRLPYGGLRTAQNRRVVVPVRLEIPRERAQEPTTARTAGSMGARFVGWTLEISRKTAGIDFFASFLVPVFDTSDAPPGEQNPEH